MIEKINEKFLIFINKTMTTTNSTITDPKFFKHANAVTSSAMTIRDCCVSTVEKNLCDFFGSSVEDFYYALKRSQALIAGGYVLGSLLGELGKKSDVDIYVSEEYFQHNLRYLLYHANIIRSDLARPYDCSFFYKNGFINRMMFTMKGDESKHVDLMIVKSNRALTAVLSNIDFTFCEVWYDGKDIYGTHLDMVLEKKGYTKEQIKDMDGFSIVALANEY